MNCKYYLKALYPTPILNTPDFKGVFGKSLLRDEVGIKALEFIALPGTIFEVNNRIKTLSTDICEVTTQEYSSKSKLYLDSRFCTVIEQGNERIKVCPTRDKILAVMKSMLGLPYVWGGNIQTGVPQMQHMYPLPSSLSNNDRQLWLMNGVDCSGMLYSATGGYFPRNTSELVNVGETVKIEGLNSEEIISLLLPLDLIVWGGHIVYVYDQNETIESRHPLGVVLTPIVDRFKEIMCNRIPVDDYNISHVKGNCFVIRRLKM